MKEYKVYFEIFGKKMKTTVLAANKEVAKAQIKNKINFILVQEVKNQPDFDIFDFLGGFK